MRFLIEASQCWGNTTVRESDPGTEICSNAMFVPVARDRFYGADPCWGIYHNDGRLVQAAAYRSGAAGALLGQSETTALDAAKLDFIDEAFIYGGPFHMHYGHFLAATLPRLWHLGALSERRRILCHGHHSPDIWFANDFVRTILGALGLTRESFVWIEQPSVIKRLWIAAPAMEEQNFVHRAYDRLGTIIGRALGVHEVEQTDHAIYLSKTKLPNGVSKFTGEEILEDALAERGVKIIHPQDLSFADQLKALAGARVITGTAGSALHSTLFLDRPARIIALTGHNVINSNLVLIDRLKQSEATYLYPVMAPSQISNQGGFQSSWSMDMVLAARDFVERLGENAWF